MPSLYNKTLGSSHRSRYRKQNGGGQQPSNKRKLKIMLKNIYLLCITTNERLHRQSFAGHFIQQIPDLEPLQQFVFFGGLLFA
jgi:hypothetical protein